MSQVKLKFIEAMAAVTPVFGALLQAGDKLTDMFAKLQGLLSVRNARASIASEVSGGNSTTDDQTILTYSIPANYLSVGGIIDVRATGAFTKPFSIGTNLTFWVKVGTTKISNFAYQPTITQGARPFNLNVVLVARAIGVSGSIVASGTCTADVSTGTPLVYSNGVVAAADTAAPLPITIGYTFSNSNATNAVSAETAIIEMK